MEDVWIMPIKGQTLRWMEDQAVRNGIHAMLKQDRCLEEQRQLGIEAANLCWWYGAELATLELAICTSESKSLWLLAYYL